MREPGPMHPCLGTPWGITLLIPQAPAQVRAGESVGREGSVTAIPAGLLWVPSLDPGALGISGCL